MASTKENVGTPPIGTILIALKRVKPDQGKSKEEKPLPAKPADGKGEAKPPDDVAKYDVVAEATQPAGSPILLKITKTNVGKETLSYWIPLGTAYPPLWEKAKVTDAVGNGNELPLSNGARVGEASPEAPGGLPPGHSLTTPAAMAPLPEGAYLIEVSGARPPR